jgi:chorismate mutase/prephenate dehydrogenase
MGHWFANFLISQGYQVEIADPVVDPGRPDARREWREGRLDQDIIVVAAPLATSGEILEALAELHPPGLIFDVGSLKSPLRKGLDALASAGCRVTSVHPMFGPDTRLLSGRHVIFSDVGNPQATREARELFDSTMAEQVEMSLEQHDRLIAFVLGLSHALNIAFFTALAESGEARRWPDDGEDVNSCINWTKTLKRSLQAILSDRTTWSRYLLSQTGLLLV